MVPPEMVGAALVIRSPRVEPSSPHRAVDLEQLDHLWAPTTFAAPESVTIKRSLGRPVAELGVARDDGERRSPGGNSARARLRSSR